jgi:hypothetical protein
VVKDGRDQHPKDSWARFDDDLGFIDAEERDQLIETEIHPVAISQVSSAENHLRRVACLEISEAQAAQFAGRPMTKSAGRRLFLVRGLSCNEGEFTVIFFRSNLWVLNSSRGWGFDDFKRQPLVVELPGKPRVVYVWCSVAR